MSKNEHLMPFFKDVLHLFLLVSLQLLHLSLVSFCVSLWLFHLSLSLICVSLHLFRFYVVILCVFALVLPLFVIVFLSLQLFYLRLPSHYFLVQQPMSWITARKFCQRHYVDLAVLSTQEQYFTLLNATAANKVSFWLGLQRQSVFSDWKWVNGEELRYQHWFRRNYEGRCASLEAMLKKDKKLLPSSWRPTVAVVRRSPICIHDRDIKRTQHRKLQ
uniref:C-type lectin domain-containing protein n=1 Tax=Amphiprion percula TaxID=161767 RepID=A0A3P8T6V0_AMPPE